jgi:hypothetical protein
MDFEIVLVETARAFIYEPTSAIFYFAPVYFPAGRFR